MDMEIKGFDFLEFKALTEDGEFEGYAAIFNNVDLGGDRILPGAFSKTLKKTGGKVPILADHMSREQIGWGLEAVEDKRGLKVRGKLNFAVQRAAEKYALAKQASEVGARMGLSIGYQAVKPSYEGDVRILKEINLAEYSLVTFPMNTRAGITAIKGGHVVLAPGDIKTNVRALEIYLRDGGISHQQAKRIASLAFRDQRDVDTGEALNEYKEVLAAIREVKQKISGGI